MSDDKKNTRTHYRQLYVKVAPGEIYAFIPGTIVKVFVEEGQEVKKGDIIKRGDILGYPFWDSEPGKNERTESKPYIDYALFFTEDITKKNIKLWTITIPSGTNCCIKKKQFKKSGRKIFLPPKCEVSTEDNIDEGSETLLFSKRKVQFYKR